MSDSNWEAVEGFDTELLVSGTDRLPVPGGWIYRTMIVLVQEGDSSVSTVFVPFARFTGAEMDRRQNTQKNPPPPPVDTMGLGPAAK